MVNFASLPECMLNYASEFTMLTENRRCLLELSITLWLFNIAMNGPFIDYFPS